jgi:hypothetical protein
MTPISTIVSAYQRFLDDDSLYGRVMECSVDKHLFIEQPTLANGRYSRRAVTVWDPLFKMWVRRDPFDRWYTKYMSRMHKENSGLSDAIP